MFLIQHRKSPPDVPTTTGVEGITDATREHARRPYTKEQSDPQSRRFQTQTTRTAHHALPTRPEGQTGFKLLGDMGDIADDINEVFSLQSSVYKAIGEPHTSSASNPAGSRAPDTPQRPMP